MLHCINIGNSYSLFNHANQKLSVYTSWNFNLIELKIDMGQDLGVANFVMDNQIWHVTHVDLYLSFWKALFLSNTALYVIIVIVIAGSDRMQSFCFPRQDPYKGEKKAYWWSVAALGNQWVPPPDKFVAFSKLTHESMRCVGK